MSTQIKSSNPEIILTRFSGGEDRGTCLDISMERDGYLYHTSIRRDQAAGLAADLLSFANSQEEQDQTVEQLEAELEATRKKISETKYLSFGMSALLVTEQELEQAVINAHLDACDEEQD
mgnify:CR=1 FL=1|tara:strand:+ start:1903 stop:2262 length:360 start_codon:yes stop_codon:yes gene_type:complete